MTAWSRKIPDNGQVPAVAVWRNTVSFRDGACVSADALKSDRHVSDIFCIAVFYGIIGSLHEGIGTESQQIRFFLEYAAVFICGLVSGTGNFAGSFQMELVVLDNDLKKKNFGTALVNLDKARYDYCGTPLSKTDVKIESSEGDGHAGGVDCIPSGGIGVISVSQGIIRFFCQQVFFIGAKWGRLYKGRLL